MADANGNKTGGRKKGTPNKLTATVKNAIAEAASDLGGKDRLVAWAKEDPENEKAFWTQLYPKLLPYQVNGPGENGEHIIKAYSWLPVQD